ncbi:MAG: hypothetical protein CMM02_09250 [Rhodopirellula sp.]|nr:hypothetical protein [Rhodopirellula sp.]|tara:strand:- start:152 stop:337 length:186 start_codon:yes stop_codon:yes gene_type:complete
MKRLSFFIQVKKRFLGDNQKTLNYLRTPSCLSLIIGQNGFGINRLDYHLKCQVMPYQKLGE